MYHNHESFTDNNKPSANDSNLSATNNISSANNSKLSENDSKQSAKHLSMKANHLSMIASNPPMTANYLQMLTAVLILGGQFLSRIHHFHFQSAILLHERNRTDVVTKIIMLIIKMYHKSFVIALSLTQGVFLVKTKNAFIPMKRVYNVNTHSRI